MFFNSSKSNPVLLREGGRSELLAAHAKIHITDHGARVHPQLWKDIQSSPIVVLMLGYSLPEWVKPLAQKRALAVLSPSEEVTSEAGKVESVFCGLLRGFADIREYYRVLELATAGVALNDRSDQKTRTL